MSVSVELWQQCVELLRDELPAQQSNTWIRPLQVEAEGDQLRVYAPNRLVLDWVNEKYLSRLLELLTERTNGLVPDLSLLIGSKRSSGPRVAAPVAAPAVRRRMALVVSLRGRVLIPWPVQPANRRLHGPSARYRLKVV